MRCREETVPETGERPSPGITNSMSAQIRQVKAKGPGGPSQSSQRDDRGVHPNLACIAWLVHGQRKHEGLQKWRCGAMEKPGIHYFHSSTGLAWEPSDVPSCVPAHPVTPCKLAQSGTKTQNWPFSFPNAQTQTRRPKLRYDLSVTYWPANQFPLFRMKTISRLLSSKYLFHCIFWFPNKVQISWFRKSLYRRNDLVL